MYETIILFRSILTYSDTLRLQDIFLPGLNIMTNRMPNIIPYLPDILINSANSNNNSKEEIIIEGSLLFADLSGFTAMSEKLGTLGRLGGEKLADIMNRCFDSLLGLVFASDGDVIKFGGDAFLALFTGVDDASRAYNCSCNLINWIAENGNISTPAGEFSLGIHAGISKGSIYNLYIGSKRKEHLFCGQTVENAYAAADAASLGQLALTEEAVKAIGDIDVRKSDERFYICQSLKGAIDFKPTPRQMRHKSEERPDMDKYIISGIQDQLHYNNGVIEGEHRVLTTLFVGIDSLRKNLEADIDRSVSAVNNYFTALNEIIVNHGGVFARLDSSGTSEKMLIFFGAPVSSGRDAHNCLKAVLEIESALSELNEQFNIPIKHRYGINTGLCFVGDVGGQWRREYTAMGDAINLAARFMAKSAYGEILVGEETIKICGDDFITRDGGLIEVKGKTQPVRIYRLDSLNEKDSSSELMIGRDKELQQARAFIERSSDSQSGLLLIAGEPGAGKSLLCARIKKIAADVGLRSIEGACFKHSEKTPYEPLKPITQKLLSLSSKSSLKQRRQVFQSQLKAIDEAEWEPLLAPFLDYFPTVPPHLRNLPDDIKKQKINEIISRLFCEINRKNQSLVIIEDIQWIDDASYNIIQSLMELKDAPGLMFISRPGKIYDDLKNRPNVENIELGALTPENCRRLFITILDGIEPDNNIIDLVIEKSGGNPFYLEEMAKAFRELGPERFAAGDNIPSGIESVITARIDNLGEMIKRTVRTASVIGRIFTYNVLKDVFPDRKRVKKLRKYLQELSHLDLTPLEKRQPVLEYIFKHILTQEVAYNGLAFSVRKSLHLKTAEYYVRQKKLVKRQPEVPARHYLLAGEDIKAMPYLLLAGQKAASEFANSEAFEFFEKVIQIAHQHNDKKYLIKTLQNRGGLAKRTGDYKLAEKDYLQFEDLVKDNVPMMAEALQNLSEIYRLTADYDKAYNIINQLDKLIPDDIPNKVYCLNGKGEITRRRGKLQDCREILLEALNLCSENDVPLDLKANLYNNLGICHWSLGKLKEAAEYYKSALSLYRRLKDLNGQSKITNNLGIISDEMGKLYQAARSYEKAEKIFKRIGATRSLAFACANLGTNLSTRGYLSQAEAKLIQAKAIFEKIGDQHSLAYTYGDLGQVYLSEGNIEKANEYFTTSLDKAYQLKDEEFILESRIRLYKLDLVQGKPKLEEIDKLIQMAEKVGSVECKIKSLIHKGITQLGNENRTIVDEIIKKLDNIDDVNNFSELSLELAKLKIINYLINGNKTRAIKLLKSSIKKAIAGDLAIYVIDISVVSEGCDLIAGIPDKTIAKIQEYFERLKNNMSDDSLQKYNAFRKRRIEALRSFISSIQPVQKTSKVLDSSYK